MMKIETKTKISAQKNNCLKILKVASCIMSAQKWSPFKAHSIPCLGDSVNLSGFVVFKVGDSAPSWYLGWHRKMLKLLSHRKTPFDASFSWTSHMGQERRKSACLSSYHWLQHISRPAALWMKKRATPTFRRIFRFLSDDKWMQRSITSLAIWMCTGSGGSTSGRVSFSSTFGGDDCSSERTELVTML